MTLIYPTEEIYKNFRVWKGKCVCGSIIYRPPDCTSKKAENCRCEYIRESDGKRLYVPRSYQNHELVGTLIYSIWCSIKTRTSNPNEPNYKKYGEKGIEMYSKWFEDFDRFYRYVKKLKDCPDISILESKGGGKRISLSIDRIDNDGNYEPRNIRWATAKQQARNRSSNVMVKWKGKEYVMAELAELHGIKNATLWWRIKQGWPIDKCLRKPNSRG